FEQAGAQERAFWEQPQERFSLVAVGAAAHLIGWGSERFAQVAAGWRHLMSGAIVESAGTCPLSAPVALGGFAFDTSRGGDAAWGDYPDALLTVPRILFVFRDGSSWLVASALVTSGCDGEAEVEAMAADLRRLLADGDGVPAREDPVGPIDLEDGDGQRWREAVAAVVREVQAGAIQKLVLARRVRACADGPLAPGPVLRRLREGYGGCTIFAFARGGSCFLGATPERLVRLDGRAVRADCLAGSAARGATEEEDRSLGAALLADGKEWHEHALVVDALREALGPLCASLSVPEGPRILRMPNVQHLHTPVEGVLTDERHILELAARLHPTPAAGGLPQGVALSLIRSYEPFERGWYAGPVGWIDGRGAGEFDVAIRSALVRESEAFLYAGCGIVAGSDPDREYQESCLKLQPMLWAINGKAS
ncbi:MAG: hypothetical protein A2148_01000, partial [Chloroflexi bacterium RBG_16_68_14]